MTGPTLPPRKGERIPRRPLPELEETEGGVIQGVTARGFAIWKVALDDINGYGPHAMIALLVVMAIITGSILLIFSLFAA